MTKKEFFDRDLSYYFVNHTTMNEIGAYCLKYWPDDAAHIIKVADEVCKKEFLFDLKWDMERTYKPVIFEDKIIWDYKPGDDPEFIYQFNRHRFFICLGQAYAMTRNEIYAKTYTELLMDWITNVPLIPENYGTTWRTIEAGLRGESFCKSFLYFINSPYVTDEIVNTFYQCMITHAEYLIKQHSILRRMSNWSVLEDHGLFTIALTLPQNEKTKEYIQTALEHLEVEAKLQILPDGVQWEQSPMYHNEVFHCYLDVIILAEKNKISLPVAITDLTHKMAYANLTWKKPNHHQFINGDSDDTDIRDFISMAAYLFKDPVLKFGGFDLLDFESIWDLGIKAAKEYEQMKKESPCFTSAALLESGNYYLRSNWSERANLLHFHCGTIGAGHGHSDKLHIDLVIQGEDVLMDSGRYTYVDGPDRYEFKDPTAHNTILVDRTFFTVCKDSWECSKLSHPINQKHCFLEDYEFVQGGHLGYMDLESSVVVNRKVIHIKPDIYIIADELYTNGSHEYEQYFHFNNQGNLFLENNHAVYTGKQIKTDFYFITPSLKTQLIKSRISRNYNLAEERSSIKTSLQQKGFASIFTVIHGREIADTNTLHVEKIPVYSYFKKTAFEDSIAEAVKLTIRETEYVVIICHREVISPTDQTQADGCLGFGNVIVFNKTINTQPGTVLLY